MIHFNNITKRYANGQEALNKVSFQLAPGELAFVTGHSGAGKSTLLKLIMLAERAQQGDILIAGKKITNLSRREIPYLRRSIGMIFQSPMLLPCETVFNNVAIPLVVNGLMPTEIKKPILTALDKVGLLGKEKCLPEELSVGEQQRVGIARAMVNKPKILLADEPTGNLDQNLAQEIMRLLVECQQAGTTVLIATHDLALIARMPYRLLMLKQGRLLPSPGASN